VLTEDGSYVTLGRARDPSEEQIQAVETDLRRQGFAGWLAIMSSSPYASDLPDVMEVRPLAEPSSPFAEAAKALRKRSKPDTTMPSDW
jgi:hypothetical protein